MKINILHNRPAVHLVFVFFFCFFPQEDFRSMNSSCEFCTINTGEISAKKSVRFMRRLTNTVPYAAFCSTYLFHTRTHTHTHTHTSLPPTSPPPPPQYHRLPHLQPSCNQNISVLREGKTGKLKLKLVFK